MKADKLDLTQIFFKPIQYRVPLFQRPYVWDRVKQWEPLWGDVEAVVNALVGASDAGAVAPHFLGAVVFDKVIQPPGMVDASTVIDGQQRLTTLLLLINAARTVALELGDERAGLRFAQLIFNDELLARSESQRLKIVPSEFDRGAFNAMMRGEPDAGRASVAEGRRIREAHAYFCGAIRKWTAETTEPALDVRLDALNTAIWRLLQVVVIELDDDDNPQVIFESLNARGTPLLAADLVKNLLFQEVEKEGGSMDALYAQYWRPLDTDPWRREVRQGRLFRPRIDVFVMHWLTMTLGTDVLVDEVYAKFRSYLRARERGAAAVVAELRAYADTYDAFDQAQNESPEGQFFYHLREMDTSTAYPVMLWIFGPDGIASVEERQRSLAAIDSWLIRRLVCGLTTKAYNDIFGRLLASLRAASDHSGSTEVVRFLRGLSGPSQEWPTDVQVRTRLRELPVYTSLIRRRLRMLFEAIEDGLGTSLSEQVVASRQLTVEHVLPQKWREHWPLRPGSDPIEGPAIRDDVLHRLGNLTLVTGSLNSVESNSAWPTKRELLDRHSLLLISKDIVRSDGWDESAIAVRTEALVDQIIQLWPGPDSGIWESG